MNIFVISADVHECAQALDDLRLNKMILETAQLLSGAAKLLFTLSQDESSSLYKTTHINHPCAIWARANKHNFIWLVNYFSALEIEREHRTGKKHLSFTKIYPSILKLVNSRYTLTEICDFHDCDPVFDFNCTDFKSSPVHMAYKLCLCNKWSIVDKQAGRTPKWTNRGAPAWYTKEYSNG